MERGNRRHIVDLNCWHLGSDASGTAVDSPSPLVAVLAGGALREKDPAMSPATVLPWVLSCTTLTVMWLAGNKRREALRPQRLVVARLREKDHHPMSPKVEAFVDALEEFCTARLATQGHPYYFVLAAELAAMVRYAARKAGESL